MAKKEVKNHLCHDCKNFELFKEKCFFFWERKKECSNHSKGDLNNIRFKSVDFSE